jgi:hypothetical protein
MTLSYISIVILLSMSDKYHHLLFHKNIKTFHISAFLQKKDKQKFWLWAIYWQGGYSITISFYYFFSPRICSFVKPVNSTISSIDIPFRIALMATFSIPFSIPFCIPFCIPSSNFVSSEAFISR